MKSLLFFVALILSVFLSQFTLAQEMKNDTTSIEKLRTESGVDPTRVQSRASYSILIQDLPLQAGIITNRVALTLGINRWSMAVKTEAVSRTPSIPGEGFNSGIGDVKFNVLNAFYVNGKHALAANAEFSVPFGGNTYGTGYFSVTPAVTYSYTIKSSLVFAIQPQYTFSLFKDPLFPDLSVITIRSFLAKFTKTGYFFVFEPRPVFDLENKNTDFIISPILGKSLGAGFNLLFLAEFPLTNNLRNARGITWQFGFNKNF
jgi:hypothetical protein